ncbi:MAG: NAD(+) synthase [Pseudomonadales bacterium]|nr:NAD(+) synthase [Pseudomonadales bacterium]MBO6597660.1 NAD(+) synthase [Pseudomonadales bacterium]MBO6658017.1 NAD(+) synthase [Pseudomonadales bacterium]MBO6703975.1 NAD(+) synthase [Pseudomonadales bacterium]MBO6823898.1 NAD(+) synthase [Pseudomonadales bacterium]
MKVCLGQINTTPGDFEKNLAAIRSGMAAASQAEADLLVFPELTIPGYLSQDLFYNPDFVEANLSVLDEILASSRDFPGLHVVVGYVGRNPSVGKPLTNMAGVVANGEMVCEYQKQLLPFYDVFDELRYFEPGTSPSIFELSGRKIGIAICEDLWNDKGTDDYNYENNPLEQYKQAGVDVVVSLNSSPFVHEKCFQRMSHITPSTESGLTVVYVNQVGGQDELVFDGQSFVASAGKIQFLSDVVFEDSFPTIDLGATDSTMVPAAIESTRVSLKDLLVLGLRDYVRKSGFDQVVLASSGGVDSAVVCMLACEALGAENVHAIRMPSVFSSEHARDDAQRLHEQLGCWDYEMPVSHEDLVASLNANYQVHDNEKNLVKRKIDADEYGHVADENIQARLRDVYVMHFSNAYGAIPLSTGNKTEAGCGYYTHFDMNFSYAPIKDLYKYQVVNLAKSDNRVPKNIWQKPPSAELAEGQTDEAALMPYAILDPIVLGYVEEYVTTFERFCDWVNGMDVTGVTGDEAILRSWLSRSDAKEDYRRIVSLIGRMEYKRRQSCPGTKVSKVAFGIGRRIPIVEKWS